MNMGSNEIIEYDRYGPRMIHFNYPSTSWVNLPYEIKKFVMMHAFDNLDIPVFPTGNSHIKITLTVYDYEELRLRIEGWVFDYAPHLGLS
jgi:hypothetical protein